MKYFYLFLICILLCYCTTEEDVIVDCVESEIKLTELETVNPSSGAVFYHNHTYDSIKANSTSIKLYTKWTIVEVNNFVLNEGLQQLKSNPNGIITEQFLGKDLIFTTYYESNGRSLPNNPIPPIGEIYISSINKECNTVSGSVFIQAVAFHDDGSGAGLGEVWSGISFDFKNLPLDNEFHKL